MLDYLTLLEIYSDLLGNFLLYWKMLCLDFSKILAKVSWRYLVDSLAHKVS